ncbi:MAG: pilus assembly protein PilP [Geoalkalibacter sp.]|jgi:type IV pilus assembly protein PilP|uniref:pilus assembly protein PilP n=1 Tax=Geoalkalibacter sp. TaxID=3041440 RepID=UPI002A97CFD2|nr:pilus assembly protein PilP [Thermodesulfobacteriota bacterium]
MAVRFFRVLSLAAVLMLGPGFAGPGASAADSPSEPPESAGGSPPSAPDYVYDPTGKRDPFQSLLEIRKPVVPDEPQTPLQTFDLDQLRLVGSIVGMKEPRAMVSAPDGKAYIVKIGTKIGKNNGVVVKILNDRIEIKESFYDFTGEVRTGIQTIQLPEREGV